MAMIAQTLPAAVDLNSTDRHLLLAGLLAVALKFAVDALRSIKTPREEVKAYLPWIVLLLGAAAGAVDHYLVGSSVTDAVVLGGAGAGSVAVNELGKLLRVALSRPGTVVEEKTAVKSEENGEPPKGGGETPS